MVTKLSGNGPRPVGRESMVDRVTDSIREAILHGALEPGERIAVQRLAVTLGTSHIPVREALRRLEGESLVTAKAHHWTVVSELSVEELQDIFELRRLLETELARRAAERHDKATKAHLLELRDIAEDRLRAGDEAFWEAHRAFHWAVFEPGLTPWSARFLNLLWQGAERYVRLYASSPESYEPGSHEHLEIFRCVEDNDADGLVKCVLEHLDMTESAIVRIHSDSVSA